MPIPPEVAEALAKLIQQGSFINIDLIKRDIRKPRKKPKRQRRLEAIEVEPSEN